MRTITVYRATKRDEPKVGSWWSEEPSEIGRYGDIVKKARLKIGRPFHLTQELIESNFETISKKYDERLAAIITDAVEHSTLMSSTFDDDIINWLIEKGYDGLIKEEWLETHYWISDESQINLI